MARAPRVAPVMGVLLGIMLTGGVVWHGSHAAFSGTTTNGPNTWAAGSVRFGPNNPVSAAVNVTGLQPGSTGAACVALTYTGTLSAPVKLYLRDADLSGTGLGAYLTLQVQEGTGTR